MFVRKNLLHQADMLKRNSLLKALALFFLGASAVLLFSSADLILNPYVSNSFVYLQKMFLTPSGTSNTVTTISFDGTSGSIVANTFSGTTMNATVVSATDRVKTPQICDAAGANCYNSTSVASLSGQVTSLDGRLAQLEALVQNLSGRVAVYHP